MDATVQVTQSQSVSREEETYLRKRTWRTRASRLVRSNSAVRNLLAISAGERLSLSPPPHPSRSRPMSSSTLSLHEAGRDTGSDGLAKSLNSSTRSPDDGRILIYSSADKGAGKQGWLSVYVISSGMSSATRGVSVGWEDGRIRTSSSCIPARLRT